MINKQQTTKKEYPFLVRLSGKEKAELAIYADKEDMSQAQVLRKGLKLIIQKSK